MPLEIPEDSARDWLRRGIAQALNLSIPVDEHAVDRCIAWIEEAGHYLVTRDDPRYPAMLREIGDAPPVLFARGRLELLQSEALGIVGSRGATPQGLADARRFAAELSSRGICIVSGMARGIDTAAHEGGLEHTGSSVAVLGTGPDTVYPRQNRALHDLLETRGCLITEFPPGTGPFPQNFPQRNRLISGLSRGVLVVEAAIQSGSLLTAYRGAKQGRAVFAMPGSIHAPLARGCHALIREGATLVTQVEHIVEDIPWWKSLAKPHVEPAATAADPFLDALGFAPLSLDTVARATGLDARSIATRLARLELEGLVRRLAGGLYQRNS